VHLHDERLTTVEAERSLKAAGADRATRRDAVDQTAATVILESFLAEGR
jgi:putative Holliday junction resolvase